MDHQRTYHDVSMLPLKMSEIFTLSAVLSWFYTLNPINHFRNAFLVNNQALQLPLSNSTIARCSSNHVRTSFALDLHIFRIWDIFCTMVEILARIELQYDAWTSMIHMFLTTVSL
jgi:hypothetical protein